MKLLFDQNISFRIIRKIEVHFPDAKQVRELGLENSSDKEIWEYAKRNNYALVTFDADFLDFNVLYGHPPKIIWLRIGNTKTDFLAEKLINNSDKIIAFLTRDDFKDVGCLELL